MNITLLKAKLHRAHVTHAELEYEGSCAIDRELLEEAGIHEYEQIQIYNVDNGERFTTYAISGEAGSRMISVNGAAAHKAEPGQRLIICAYAYCDASEVASFSPKLVYLDKDNNITHTSDSIPQQLAEPLLENTG